MGENQRTSGRYMFRDLQSSTRLVQTVTCVSLLLELVRLIWRWHAAQSVSPDAGLAPSSEFTLGQYLDLALGISILASAIVGLIWLQLAKTNAHALKPPLKHAITREIWWFLVPAINIRTPIYVVYDIWNASGGDPKEGRIIFIWWALTWISGFVFLIWTLGSGLHPSGQFTFAGSGVSFLILVTRIDKLQRRRAIAAVFGEADKPAAPKRHFAETLDIPPTVLDDVFRDLEPERKERSLQPATRASLPTSLEHPGVIYVQRPSGDAKS